VVLVEPEVVQLVLRLIAAVQLETELAKQAAIPLARGEVLPDGSEIEDGGGDAGLLKASGGADHEGALAHLSGGEDIAVLAPQQGLKQVGIGLSLHVGGGIGRQRPARRVEVGLRSSHTTSNVFRGTWRKAGIGV